MIYLKPLLENKDMILEYQNKIGSTIVVIKGKSKGDAEVIFRHITKDILKQLGEEIKKFTLEY